MKNIALVIGLVIVSTIALTCPESSRAQSNGAGMQPKGKVCPNPASPCVKIINKGVKDYSHGDKPVISTGKNLFDDADLSFRLPAKLIWPSDHESADFYAIVLRIRPAVVEKDRMAKPVCEQGYYSEKERTELQKMFPTHKVFASRNGCAAYYFGYTNAYEGDETKEFVAVYAGNTEAEAKRFLKRVRATKEFAGATYRKMQVVLGYGD